MFGAVKSCRRAGWDWRGRGGDYMVEDMVKRETEDLGGPDWLTGQLLVAMPAMQDQRFVQSVIFI